MQDLNYTVRMSSDLASICPPAFPRRCHRIHLQSSRTRPHVRLLRQRANCLCCLFGTFSTVQRYITMQKLADYAWTALNTDPQNARGKPVGCGVMPFVCPYGVGLGALAGPCVSINRPPRIGVLSSSFIWLASRALRSSLSFRSVSIVAACWLM